MPLLESCFFKSLNWYLFSATNDSQWHRLKFRSFVTWSYTYYYKYTLKIYRPILSTFALTDYFTAGRKKFLIKKKKKGFGWTKVARSTGCIFWQDTTLFCSWLLRTERAGRSLCLQSCSSAADNLERHLVKSDITTLPPGGQEGPARSPRPRGSSFSHRQIFLETKLQIRSFFNFFHLLW